MLPPDFRWEPYIDGGRLWVGDTVLAHWTPLNNGGARICLHSSNARHLRYEFTDSPAEAIEYVETWVRRWEADLRKLYQGSPTHQSGKPR